MEKVQNFDNLSHEQLRDVLQQNELELSSQLCNIGMDLGSFTKELSIMIDKQRSGDPNDQAYLDDLLQIKRTKDDMAIIKELLAQPSKPKVNSSKVLIEEQETKYLPEGVQAGIQLEIQNVIVSLEAQRNQILDSIQRALSNEGLDLKKLDNEIDDQEEAYQKTLTRKVIKRIEDAKQRLDDLKRIKEQVEQASILEYKINEENQRLQSLRIEPLDYDDAEVALRKELDDIMKREDTKLECLDDDIDQATSNLKLADLQFRLQKKIQEIKMKLDELKQKYGIQTIDQILDDLKDAIINHEKLLGRENQQSKANEIEMEVNDLRQMLEWETFLNNNTSPINQERVKQENELNQGLIELQIQDDSLLDQLITTENYNHQNALELQDFNKLTLIQTKIQKLKILLKLRNKLYPQRKQEKVQQQYENTPSSTSLSLIQYSDLQSAITNIRSSDHMPDCFEKSLVKLLYYSCLTHYGQPDQIFYKQDWKNVFEELYEKLP